MNIVYEAHFEKKKEQRAQNGHFIATCRGFRVAMPFIGRFNAGGIVLTHVEQHSQIEWKYLRRPDSTIFTEQNCSGNFTQFQNHFIHMQP